MSGKESTLIMATSTTIIGDVEVECEGVMCTPVFGGKK